MDDRYKDNGTKLVRLIIDKGTEAMRNVFDSICPPPTLTTTLNINYNLLQRGRVINRTQMDTLFPPIPFAPSTSEDYDITLLFILLRNICGLHPPASTGGLWDKLPLPTDPSREADLTRIKYYRNVIYGHITTTAVNDAHFQSYWNDISAALIRLGINVDEIEDLKYSPLHEINGNLVNLKKIINQQKNIEASQDKIKKKHSTLKTGQKNLLKSLNKFENVGKELFNVTYQLLLLLLLLVIIVLITVLPSFYSLPRETQDSFALDFSSHLNISNSDFVGRQWLFQELEQAINNSREQSGVLILGDPGSGKSAIMSQLISSPSSSPFIHKNIIGYHLCLFDERRTRDGMRFVHTLVEQLSRNIPEYSSVIKKAPLQKELNIHCMNDSIGCFATTILDPIKGLKGQRNTNKFILIDELDECIEKDGKNSEIITILVNKMTNFPNWIKLIISSRNKTSLIDKLPTMATLVIHSEDRRNLKDIYSYAEHIMLRNDSFKTSSLQKGLQDFIYRLIKISGGNFLYFKVILEYLVKNRYQMGLESFPPSLDRLYSHSIKNRFEDSDFNSFAPLLEVILASNAPLTLTELDAIFKHQNKEYDTHRYVKKISEYLIFGSDGTVRFYHQSFANWLINQDGKIDGLSITKCRGHRTIANYHFHHYHQRNTTLTLEELSMLSVNVLFGGMEKGQVRELKGLNVSEIRDPLLGKCILHELALKRESTGIMEVFLDHFESVDILDNRRWIPAFYAVYKGNFKNVKYFIYKGTDVNYDTGRQNVSRKPEFAHTNPRNIASYASSMLLIAAQKGYTKIAELLINNGADFEKSNVFGLKPLHVTAVNGHFDLVKLLVNRGAVADVIALHHAAARNHSDIVRFLLDIGIRDVCLSCKPRDISSCFTSTNVSLNQSHLCFCETALHAAVSRGFPNIVKLLLSYGNDTLECRHLSGRTPLMDAVERNNTKMVTLLLNKGANVEAECENKISSESVKRYKCENINEWDSLYTPYCDKDVCSCGSRSIHLCAKRGQWEMAKELIFRWNATPFSENSQGLTAINFAAIQDRVDFIQNLYAKIVIYVGNITKFILDSKTVMSHIAVCGSVNTLELLSSNTNTSAFSTVYNGMTLLHLAALWSPHPKHHSNLYITLYREIWYCSEVIDNNSCLLPNKTCFSQRHVENEYKKRLMTIRLLTKLQQNIDKTDKYGRTALHYAAARGFAGAVRHLVRQGSDWRIKDQNGDTPLELALKESHLHPKYFLPCRMTSDGVFQSCNSTMFDETVRYLIMLQKSTIKKCNTDTKRLLRTLVKKNMPLSLYDLFKIGVDVNCGVALKMQLNISKLRNDEISEVFKIFEVNVNVKCDVPFNQSELHLMAYLGRPSNIGNFFKPSVNNRSFPFERLINNHPKGFRVLDECYDKEGYLVIHRAVQGRNVDAVSWFISLGVDIFKKTRSGWNALDISIYYLVAERYSRLTLANSNLFLIHQHYDPLHVEIDQQLLLVQKEIYVLRELIFENLLKQSLKTIKSEDSESFSWCKPDFTTLSPLHIAASQGMEMLKYIHQKARRLPISCTNKHRIEPRYLAYLYESIEDKDINRKPFDLSNEGRSLQYPEREAEYHLIYNHIFQTPEVDLSFKLDFEGLFKCSGVNNLLPDRKEMESQMEQCNSQCWKSTSQLRRTFLSVFPNIPIGKDIFVLLSIEERYGGFFTGSVFDNSWHMSELRYISLKKFYKIPSRLWRQVSKAYSCAYRCRCIEVMQLLQKEFTSQPRRYKRVGKFMAERMGWNTSTYGDALDRWPFHFLLNKALKKDKDYEYLKIIGADLEY